MRNKNNPIQLARLLSFAMLLATVVAGCSSKVTETTSTDNAMPHRGGTFRFATVGEPPSLDMMVANTTNSMDVTTNIFEGLFTVDPHFLPQPSLAENYTTEDQGRRWVIALRKGVLFHNGQEMTSDDVLASLNRWGRITSSGHTLFQNLASPLEAPDRYSIVIHLKQPMPIVANLLAIRSGQAAIYPKSVVNSSGDGEIKEYIGTGPYRFVSWKRNQYIELARFDRYVARTEPADGMTGQREAYFDKIRFIPVREVQQRVQGVQTGLYDFAISISPDLYASLQNTPSIETMIVKPSTYPVFILNMKQGLFRDLKMRQAVQATADFQSIMQAAFGDTAFYRLDPSLNYKETKWWSDAGKDRYNQNNPGTAKQLLKEAGYRGQTVRILTTHEYEYMYKSAVVLKSQLEAIGMQIAPLIVVDWATMNQTMGNSKEYDISSFAFQNFNDPGATSYWDETSSLSGWWVNSQKDSLLQQISTESNYDKRIDLLSQFQELVYEEVPQIKVGDSFSLRIRSKKVHGSGLSSPLLYLFNCWLSK